MVSLSSSAGSLAELSRIETDFARELGQLNGDPAFSEVIVNIIGIPYDDNL
jgi:hypothetical protein